MNMEEVTIFQINHCDLDEMKTLLPGGGIAGISVGPISKRRSYHWLEIGSTKMCCCSYVKENASCNICPADGNRLRWISVLQKSRQYRLPMITSPPRSPTTMFCCSCVKPDSSRPSVRLTLFSTSVCH